MSTKTGKSTARLRTISPQFVVPDVVSAAQYCRDVLGCQIPGYFREPGVYSIFRREAIEIHLGKADAGRNGARHARIAKSHWKPTFG
jgi:hypothetical protein